VARDRQRAKQRKARRAQNPGPARSEPYRADLPGELEHASGEVDEFDATLVAGAGGLPADAQSDADDAFVADEEERQAGRQRRDDEDDERQAGRQRLDDEDDEDLDAELEQAAVAATPIERTDVVPAGTPGAATRRGPGRFIGFLRASWAELQRVQWPDRRQVTQATAVVIGFVVVAGLYLGVADWVAKKIVDYII
jgi:preprotein translocase subunit SecE